MYQLKALPSEGDTRRVTIQLTRHNVQDTSEKCEDRHMHTQTQTHTYTHNTLDRVDRRAK